MYDTVAKGKKYYDKDKDNECSQKPGTILRIFIPAGAVINLLNLLEVTSPSGICLIVRVPALGGGLANNVLNSIKQAGGTIEVLN